MKGETKQPSPVPWANWGPLSGLIARSLPTRSPAVAILSLPRSGSSWVGDMLRNTRDGLYLREPVTQGDPLMTDSLVFDPDVRDDPADWACRPV